MPCLCLARGGIQCWCCSSSKPSLVESWATSCLFLFGLSCKAPEPIRPRLFTSARLLAGDTTVIIDTCHCACCSEPAKTRRHWLAAGIREGRGTTSPQQYVHLPPVACEGAYTRNTLPQARKRVCVKANRTRRNQPAAHPTWHSLSVARSPPRTTLLSRATRTTLSLRPGPATDVAWVG